MINVDAGRLDFNIFPCPRRIIGKDKKMGMIDTQSYFIDRSLVVIETAGAVDGVCSRIGNVIASTDMKRDGVIGLDLVDHSEVFIIRFDTEREVLANLALIGSEVALGLPKSV